MTNNSSFIKLTTNQTVYSKHRQISHPYFTGEEMETVAKCLDQSHLVHEQQSRYLNQVIQSIDFAFLGYAPSLKLYHKKLT